LYFSKKKEVLFLEEKINCKIGIDKSIIHGFEIEILDEKRLNAGNIEYRKNPNSPLKTKNVINIEKLSIKDTFFGELLCCISKNRPITKMMISASSENNFSNLSVDEYKSRIIEIFNYLYNEYKIKIYYNFNSLYISYIEINTTFKLNYLFKNYCRALFIIMRNMPSKSFTKNNFKGSDKENKIIAVYMNNEKELEIETIEVYNSSRDFIIYNKTKQLKDKNKLSLNDDYMRIEYKLKRKDSYINTYLGSTVNNLTDIKINNLFLELFDNDIVKPIDNFRKEVLNNIMNELKEVYKNNGNKFPKNWRENLLDKIISNEINHKNPIIIDYTDIEKAIRGVKLFRHPKRVIDNLKNKIETNKNFTWLKDCNKQINEIIENVLSCDINKNNSNSY